MKKLSEIQAECKKAADMLEENLKNDPDLKARLDGELYKCELLREKELAKEEEKIKRHR